jgi:hypothetical protein
VRQILHGCVAAGGLDDAYVAMVCTRGVPPRGARDPRLATNRFYAYALPFVWIAPPEKQAQGIDLHVSRRIRIAPDSVDPTIKNYHWLDLVLSMFDAYDRGADTSCVVDAAGQHRRRPGLQRLHGRGRRRAHARPRRARGHLAQDGDRAVRRARHPDPVEPVPAAALAAADEVFLSSTGGGVLPIARVDGRSSPAGRAGDAPPARRVLGAARRPALPRSDRALRPRPPGRAAGPGACKAGRRTTWELGPWALRRSADSSPPAGAYVSPSSARTESVHEQLHRRRPVAGPPIRRSPPTPTRSPRSSSASARAPSPCAAAAARSARRRLAAGLVVTAAHVFRRAPAAITLVGGDGKSVEATLVGIDSSTDLALFRLAVSDAGGVPAGRDRRRRGVRAGHFVVAVGRSGEGDAIASAGIVNRAAAPGRPGSAAASTG